MKNLLKPQFLPLALLCLLFVACIGSVETQITGTYVKSASSEFSVAFDTLVLERRNDQYYLIHRKTGFRRMDELGKPGKLQLETEEWNAVYDESSGSMTESRKGRIISFDLNNGVLLLGNGRYQRIN